MIGDRGGRTTTPVGPIPQNADQQVSQTFIVRETDNPGEVIAVARLRLGAIVRPVDLNLTSANLGGATPNISVVGGTLASNTATFTWSVVGASNYWLYFGTTGQSSSNILNEPQGTGISKTISTLPINGQPIYVRLWWLTDSWHYKDILYTAGG